MSSFLKLLVVCLKMLFRKSTRKRFVCLVMGFLLVMAFNTFSYISQYHRTDSQKQYLFEEKAFKVFFVRTRTRRDCEGFLNKYRGTLSTLGADILNRAFLYQNNLFIHFVSSGDKDPAEKNEALELLYRLFDIERDVKGFYSGKTKNEYDSKLKDHYLDYNGSKLSDEIIDIRDHAVRDDLIDIADMIREGLHGKRLELFNKTKYDLVNHMNRVSLDRIRGPNPYLSRIEHILPLNYFTLLTNMRNDNTTDIIDLADSIRVRDGEVEVAKKLLTVPSADANGLMFLDIDIYPRYLPLYIPEISRPCWHWLMFQDIDLNLEFINTLEQLHFKGHYVFSYEKINILKNMVKKINADIRSNMFHFYLIDFSVGVAFPFMISLFAFIHLKSEISFLFMFKNRIRELLIIFWLLPIVLILLVKTGLLLSYLFYASQQGFNVGTTMSLPLAVSFLLASTAFYPINRWCFIQFTGNRLNLYALHKGS